MNSYDAKILVVDDEECIRSFLSGLFQKEGYPVETAEDGTNAIAIERERLCELAFVDVRMPGMDGVETMKQLITINPGVKVIVMTGYTAQEREREAIDAGAYRFIHKPFDIEEIINMVKELIK